MLLLLPTVVVGVAVVVVSQPTSILKESQKGRSISDNENQNFSSIHQAGRQSGWQPGVAEVERGVSLLVSGSVDTNLMA